MTIDQGKVRIASSAMKEMVDECLRYDGIETGTVLIGRWDGDTLDITKAIRPGPGASRTRSSFSPDTPYAQYELDIYREAHADHGWVGVHHQHPPSLPSPSFGDLRQAQDILNDRDCKPGNRFVSIISIRHGTNVHFFPFVLSQDAPRFRPLKLEIAEGVPPPAMASQERQILTRPATLVSRMVHRIQGMYRSILRRGDNT